jgi:hypothetical protein
MGENFEPLDSNLIVHAIAESDRSAGRQRAVIRRLTTTHL